MEYTLVDWARLPLVALVIVSLVYCFALRRRGYGYFTALLYASPIVVAGIAVIWFLGGVAPDQ